MLCRKCIDEVETKARKTLSQFDDIDECFITTKSLDFNTGSYVANIPITYTKVGVKKKYSIQIMGIYCSYCGKKLEG